MVDDDFAVHGSMASPTAVWADLKHKECGADATSKRFMPPAPLTVTDGAEPEPARACALEDEVPSPSRPAPMVTERQVRCLKTLFRMYGTRVFMPGQERVGLVVPSRMVLSLSRDGWNRFCRDIMRGGVTGLPLIPFVRMLSLYDEHAARLPHVTPRPEFQHANVTLPRRDVQPVYGWGAFVDLLEAVADQWYASLGSVRLRVKRTPWVSPAAARGVAASSLSAMCDEVACSSFHNPIAEKQLTTRQLFPTGDATESRRSLLPQRVALWDLLSSPGA